MSMQVYICIYIYTFVYIYISLKYKSIGNSITLINCKSAHTQTSSYTVCSVTREHRLTHDLHGLHMCVHATRVTSI